MECEGPMAKVFTIPIQSLLWVCYFGASEFVLSNEGMTQGDPLS